MGTHRELARVARKFAGAAITAAVLVGAGPAASAFADVEGQTNADSTQSGDNSFGTTQGGDFNGGDAVAGSNIVGNAGRGDATIRVQNTSRDALAESGDLDGSNDVGDVNVGNQTPPAAQGPAGPPGSPAGLVGPLGPVGPVAEAADIDGVTTGDIVQDGDNRLRLRQTIRGEGGDAVAGGNVVGSAQAGNVNIDVANDSTRAAAFGGDLDVANDFGAVRVGDVVVRGPTGPAGSPGDDAGGLASDIGPATSALIVQDGDNEFSWSQQGSLTGGDAVAGANVVGLAGAGNVDAFVRNTSTDSESFAGDLELDNSLIDTRIGSLAVGPVGPQGPAGPSVI